MGEITTIVNNIFFAAGILVLAAFLVGLVRFVLGPSTPDRMIAFDVLTIISIALIAMVAHWAARGIYLDVAIVYGLLSFLGVLTVGRYLERGL
jgi:multicomponent Na+:H+ antiporter subunit F